MKGYAGGDAKVQLYLKNTCKGEKRFLLRNLPYIQNT